MKLLLNISSLVLALLLMNCNIMEPEFASGSLRIQLITHDQQSKAQMAKSADLLGSVCCIVKNETEIVFNHELTYQGDTFKGDIDGLEPGDDYSVILYGKNSQDAVIGYGSEYGISITAGETKAVSVVWGDFRPALISPGSGESISTYSPVFSWHAVNGAVKYDIAVYYDNNTRITDVVRDSSLTQTEYTGKLTQSADVTAVTGSSIKYGWRTRCQDREGVWGAWSDVNIFYVLSNSIRVLSPNGGEVWKIGSKEKIKWESTLSDDVEIKLYKGTTIYKVLEYGCRNTGVYEWSVPNDITAGDQYKIRIFSKTSSYGDDMSDDFFSITD